MSGIYDDRETDIGEVCQNGSCQSSRNNPSEPVRGQGVRVHRDQRVTVRRAMYMIDPGPPMNWYHVRRFREPTWAQIGHEGGSGGK